MIFFRLFQHLLPRARAWNITIKKSLRSFFEALTIIGTDFKAFADQNIFLNFFALTTDDLDLLLSEFGLRIVSTLPDSEKRIRLQARRAETGGQGPYYIQNILQKAGFDVYIHEWWEPGYIFVSGTEGAVCGDPDVVCGGRSDGSQPSQPLAKNPLLYLRRTYLPKGGFTFVCNLTESICFAEDAICGISDEKKGYPLVNKIDVSVKNYSFVSDDSFFVCGNENAVCGAYSGITETEKDYIIPLDEQAWRFFVYVSAQDFPELAQIPLIRKNEFEELCLRLFPTHLWLGILVEYV